MGTPELAAHILDALLTASDPVWQVAAAVTQPDRPRGRGLVRLPSAVAEVCGRRMLPVLKPERVRRPEFAAELGALSPDVLAVAAYGRILPPSILETPRLIALNVHASLLPRYRGAAPIQAAILAGDKQTGVTIMRMVERMDAGPILLQSRIEIAAAETAGTLTDKLAELGAQALMDCLRRLAQGTISETAQNEALATYTRTVTKQDAHIDWSESAAKIERAVRAYDPWPVAFTFLGGSELRIYRAALEQPNPAQNESSIAAPGTIVALSPRGAPIVQCGSGRLRLMEVQAAGRKRMSAEDFARGRRIGPGAILGANQA